MAEQYGRDFASWPIKSRNQIMKVRMGSGRKAGQHRDC